MAKVDAQVAALAAMKPTEIKAEWRRVHDEEPPRVAASLLARSLAYDLQCAARGGAGERMRQKLMASGGGATRSASAKACRGTQLVREWGGVSHHVLMEEKGRCSFRARASPLSQLSPATSPARIGQARASSACGHDPEAQAAQRHLHA